MSIARRFVSSTVFLLLAFLVAAAALAQSETATIAGRITDPRGGVVIGADVHLENTTTGVSVATKTNGDGIYVIPHVQPGSYRILVQKEGFKEVVRTGLSLHVQDNAEENFSLEVGSLSESITVTADQLNLNTTDGTVSTVIDHSFSENLPLNGRSFQALIDLTPGVVQTAASFALPGQFSVNGQRSDANYFTVDGVSANVPASSGVPLTQYGAGVYPALSASGGTNSLVSIEALEEFRVQTSTFAPEFGRVPGAQVSIMTRSGASQFHGTAFDYFRNDVLDANDWFSNADGFGRQALRQNDFGGVFSGPIVPKHLFFFFSYEGLRLLLPQTITEEVPSVDFRENAIPAMQTILNAFPIPAGALQPDGLQNFTGTTSTPSSLNATSLRVDYNLSKRWTIFGRYNYSPSNSATRGDATTMESPSELDHFTTTTQTGTVGVSTVISPAIANEFRFNYSHISADSFSTLDTFGGAVPFPSSLVFPAGFNTSNGLVDLDLNVFGSPNALLEEGRLSDNLQRQVNLVDNVSYSLGAHLLKFGVDYRHLSPAQHPGAYSQLVGFADEPSAQAGSAFIAEVSAIQPTINFVFTNFSLYAQDTWKVTPRLTLTYGLRWDFNPVPGTSSGTPRPYTLSDIQDPATTDGSTLTSLAPEGTRLYSSSHHDFAPRLGVAYQLRNASNWTTVLRGGFGLFNNISSSVYGDVAGGFPYVAEQNVFGVSYPSQAPTLTPPPLNEVTFPIGRLYVPDPNLKTPYSLQWNVAVEQQLGHSDALSVSYVGAAGRDLIYQRYLFGPNADFNFIGLSVNGTTSDYGALQIQYRRQVTRGLQALVSYTWSHAIDEDSDTEGSTAPFRGNAEFDIRHSFTAGWTYDLPTPHWGNIGDDLLRGWGLDGSMFARTAVPVDLVGAFSEFPEFFEARPDVVPGQPFYIRDPGAPGGRSVNPAAFVPAPGGVEGDLGRNVIRGLGAWQVDFAVRRNFRLFENLTLQFRAEAFNLFNHSNFGPPDGVLGDSTFGVPTQTLAESLGAGGVNGGFNPLYQIGGPRSVQFALKLMF